MVNGVEIKPSGQGYRVKQSFSRFKNMSELQLLFRNFADVLTDIPGLKIPKMAGGKVNVVVCEPGQFQQDYMKELEQQGYVELIPVAGTRRELYVKLTEQGQAYADQVLKPVYDAEQELYEKYFEKYDTSFVVQLHQFSTAMKQYFATGEYEDPEGTADEK